MLERYESTRELSVDPVDVVCMRDIADEFLNGYRLHENDEEELTRRVKVLVRAYIIASFEQNRMTLPADPRLIAMTPGEALANAKSRDWYEVASGSHTITKCAAGL